MTVLRARALTPVDADTVVDWPDARVEIVDGRFVSIGPWTGGACDEDLRPHVIVPGFVDGHIHFPQTRIVGRASGPLLDWLAGATFPEEARFADPAHAASVAEVFARSLAAAGTTWGLVYGPVFPDAVDALARTLRRRGQHARLGPVWMDDDSPAALTTSIEATTAGLDALREDHHGRDGIEIAVIPRFALSCTRKALEAAGRYAADHQLTVSTHLAENRVECALVRERFGVDYLDVYADAGLLVPGAVFAHTIHLTDAAWDRFAAAGAVVAHCPDSNGFLGSGTLPVGAVLDRGIPLTVGTDIAAGRSFRVPTTLSFAYDNALRDGRFVTPARLWWWGTRGGALALGRDDTGALVAGMAADFLELELPPWVETREEVLAAILFDLDAARPVRTFVAGRVVYERAVDGVTPWAPPAR